MIDATIVEIPIQRDTRKENKQAKAGETSEDWEKNPAKKRQKDNAAHASEFCD